MRNYKLAEQHQGSIYTCTSIQEAARYFLRHVVRTSIQINQDLSTASPRDTVRTLKANGFVFEGRSLPKTRNGKIPYQWKLIKYPIDVIETLRKSGKV